MDISKAMRASASAMLAESVRLRTIAENLANADSTGTEPNADPYRRKLVSFKSALDRASGAQLVKVSRIDVDRGEFRRRFDPQHPAADNDGYVRMPNVNSLIEVMDMRQAQRSYEANLSMIETAKQMLQRTIDLLRA